MTDKEIAKKAVELADKEAQEKYIDNIKKVVQNYLEKIDEANGRRRAIDEELRILKSDLDDIKSGRLDKIKERQDREPKAKEISPIIIKIIEREYLPLAPWRSPWMVEWKWQPPPTLYCGDTLNTNLVSTNAVTLTATGTTWANCSAGTYQVNDRIINF